MVRPRTGTTEGRDREMAQAGARFETYVKAAMAEADDLPTLAELYRQSGIGASTWNAWFRGLRRPRGNSLRLAGVPIDKTPEQLLAAWDGDQPPKPRRATQTGDPVVDAIEAQTTVLKGVLDAILARLSESSSPSEPPPEVLEEVSSAELSVRPGSGSPPRTPGPDRRGAGKATRRRSVDRA